MAWYDNRNNPMGIYLARTDSSGKKIAQGGLTGTLKGSQEGYYYIKSVPYDTYLTSNSDGTGLLLTEYSTAAGNRQIWEILDSDNNGYFTLRNKYYNNFIYGIQNSNGDLSATLGLKPDEDQATICNWWLYDNDDNGTYLLRIRYKTSYRIFAEDPNSVCLLANAAGGKYFEIIPAGF